MVLLHWEDLACDLKAVLSNAHRAHNKYVLELAITVNG